jgi:hypothetical protein
MFAEFWSNFNLVTPVNHAPPCGKTTSCATESYIRFGGLVEANAMFPSGSLMTKAKPEEPDVEPVTFHARS